MQPSVLCTNDTTFMALIRDNMFGNMNGYKIVQFPMWQHRVTVRSRKRSMWVTLKQILCYC